MVFQISNVMCEASQSLLQLLSALSRSLIKHQAYCGVHMYSQNMHPLLPKPCIIVVELPAERSTQAEGAKGSASCVAPPGWAQAAAGANITPCPLNTYKAGWNNGALCLMRHQCLHQHDWVCCQRELSGTTWIWLGAVFTHTPGQVVSDLRLVRLLHCLSRTEPCRVGAGTLLHEGGCSCRQNRDLIPK